MNHHRIAITGILFAQVLFFGLPTMAADDPVTVDTVNTTSAEWRECLTLLRLKSSIAEVGTYRIRMVECVNEKIRNQEVGDVDREHRLSLRAQNVINAFRSGRLGATARSVDTRRLTNNNYQVPQDDAQNAIRFQRRIPTVRTTENSQNSNANYSRPSRRSIQDGAYSQSISDKQTESEIFQQRWKDAIDACKEIENNFTRNNCIRLKLRQSGAN